MCKYTGATTARPSRFLFVYLQSCQMCCFLQIQYINESNVSTSVYKHNRNSWIMLCICAIVFVFPLSSKLRLFIKALWFYSFVSWSLLLSCRRTLFVLPRKNQSQFLKSKKIAVFPFPRRSSFSLPSLWQDLPHVRPQEDTHCFSLQKLAAEEAQIPTQNQQTQNVQKQPTSAWHAPAGTHPHHWLG